MKRVKTKKLVILSLLFLFTMASSNLSYRLSEETIAGEIVNVEEKFKSAFRYFKNDSLKLQALRFLVENMKYHFSENLTTGERGDLDKMTSSFLINHINMAFDRWKQPYSNHFSFDFFCEYILPYRASIEPLQSWQSVFQDYIDNRFPVLTTRDPLSVGVILNNDMKSWFVNSFALQKGSASLLGPVDLLNNKTGGCHDMTNLAAIMFREAGLPCAVDYTPFWANATGGHYWNYTFDSLRLGYSFMGAEANYDSHVLIRKVAKVYRFMYSYQKDHIAARVPKEKISIENFQVPITADVTRFYTNVSDVSWKIENNLEGNVLYLCVFNGLSWHPVAAEQAKNGILKFSDVGCGIVLLPMDMNNCELNPVGDPVILNNDGETEYLSIDTISLQRIVFGAQNLNFHLKPSQQYSLFFWNKRWCFHSSIFASEESDFSFNKVPISTLFLLIPEDTKGKERIFTIGLNGRLSFW